MSTYADRLASFTAWPHASPTPEQMARAGFKHMPTNKYPDNVSCSCGDGNHDLCGWKPDDDPKLQLHIHNYRCSRLWMVLATTERKMPSTKDIGFFDPSLAYDFPELCLFQNVKTFCDRIRRLRFFETDILDLLPKCLRGKALEWFNQSGYRDLAACLGAMRARFWQQAPPEAPLGARFQRQAPPEGPPQAPPQAPPEAPPRAPEYHHCKLCNASFSSMARLMRHTQENICNKPSCRYCEKVFSSKNRLHQHLREKCPKQMYRKSSPRSSSTSSPSPPPEENKASLPSSPSPSPSPPPAYRAISPPPPTYLTIEDLSARYAAPPYLKVDDLFRMFGGRSATTASSTITITIDDPFTRPFVFKKSMGSTIWESGMATRHHQIAQAQYFLPRSIYERCRRPPLLEHQHRQVVTRPNLV